MIYSFGQWTWIYDFKNKKWDKFNWCVDNANDKFLDFAKTHNVNFFTASDIEESYSKFDIDEVEFMGFDNPLWKENVKVVNNVG